MSRSERAAQLLDLPVIGSLLQRAPAWRGVLVLGYHRIGDGSLSLYDRSLWSATEEVFDRQLGYLTRNFEVIAADDLPAAIAAGRGRHVLLTFDDGYRDNFERALPLLRSHGTTAVFFVVPGFIDSPRVAWWDEIAWMIRCSDRDGLPAGEPLPEPIAFDEPDRDLAVATLIARYKQLPSAEAEALLDQLADATGSGRADPTDAAETWITWSMARQLRDAGMSVGGHTVDHPILARLAPADQREQVAGCARRLEAELGGPMRLFSYPVGLPDAFDHETRACLADEGVELAFTLYGGLAGAEQLDRYDVPRTTVSAATTPAMFRSTMRLPQLLARY